MNPVQSPQNIRGQINRRLLPAALIHIITKFLNFFGDKKCLYWLMLATTDFNLCGTKVAGVGRETLKCESVQMKDMRKTKLKRPVRL